MLTMSPSASFRGPGIPWTTSSLIEMHVDAGKGTLPGTPLNSGIAWCSSKTVDRGVDLRGGHARAEHRRGQLVRLPHQQPRLAHQLDVPTPTFSSGGSHCTRETAPQPASGSSTSLIRAKISSTVPNRRYF